MMVIDKCRSNRAPRFDLHLSITIIFSHLMFEMPLSGEDHGYGMMICHADSLIITNRAARLNDCCDASFGSCLDTVGKGEVGIGGQHRTSCTLRGFFYG